MTRSWATILVAVALAAIATSSLAAPYRPNPDQVVLRIDSAISTFSAGKAQSVATLDEALELAASWIDAGRRSAQPRQVGRGEALLQSWRTRALDSVRWHVLAADIHQYRHDYSQALDLLDGALALEPGDPHARLMRASVRQTQGEFQAARADCAYLLGSGEAFIGTTCLAQILGLTGSLDRAHGILSALLHSSAGSTTPAVRMWALSALADMEERRGEPNAAERQLRAALLVEPSNLYLRLTLADFLLAHRRPGEVRDTMAGLPMSQGTLLRLAEADKSLGKPFDQLTRRVRAAMFEGQQRGERIDQRDVARLARLEGRRCGALAAARSNWTTQREPFDLRLLIVSAVECGDAGSLAEAMKWRRENRYEDAVADAWLTADSAERSR